MMTIEIDFSNILGPKELHRILAKELGFPAFYGRNWDAFWDCITDPDFSKMPDQLLLKGWSSFETRLSTEARILSMLLIDYQAQNLDFKITLD